MQLRLRRRTAVNAATAAGSIASAATAAASVATAAAATADTAPILRPPAAGGGNRGNRGRARQPFALAPLPGYPGVIDYTIVEGRKFYEKATQELSEEGFDCQNDSLRAFIEDLERRSEAFGWSDPTNDILFIPDKIPNPTHKTNLLQPSDDSNKEKEAPPKTKVKKEKEPRKPTKASKLASALSNIVNEDDSSGASQI